MPIQSIKVQLSFIPKRLERMREFGKKQLWKKSGRELKNATVGMNIIEFVLDTSSDPDVQKYLNKHGGTFLDLVLRALKKYIDDND